MAEDAPRNADIEVEPMWGVLSKPVEERLSSELGGCPDVAFAHLLRVRVAGDGQGPQPSLFVWLVPEAVPSLRGALNTVSEAVARALPEELYLDVLILNSAPELLLPVEEAGGLIVERDPGERRRALDAALQDGPKVGDRSQALDSG